MKRNSEIQKIAFVGDYLPRKCGIATFTYDLCTSVATQYPGSDCFVVPINDISPRATTIPAEVRFEIEEQELDSYLRAADFLNFANADIVCLQHEYGIFGGPAGSHIVRLLRDLRMPIVTTLHTVLREPSDDQRRVLDQVAELSARLVVMSERARDVSPGDLRRPRGQDRPDRPRHPRHAVRRPQLLQGPVRGRGQVRRADLRPALAQQGDRAHAPGDAGDPQGVPQLRLHRAGGDPPQPDPRAGGAVPDQPGAAGQGPGHQAQRQLLQPVRRDRRADRIHRDGRHLHHALPEPGADHLGDAGLLVRLRQGGDLDALLVRRGAAGRRPRGARPVRRLGGPGPRDLRAACATSRGGTRCARRPTCWAGR